MPWGINPIPKPATYSIADPEDEDANYIPSEYEDDRYRRMNRTGTVPAQAPLQPRPNIPTQWPPWQDAEDETAPHPPEEPSSSTFTKKGKKSKQDKKKENREKKKTADERLDELLEEHGQ